MNKSPFPIANLAILNADTLSSMGLAHLLRQFVPFATITTYGSYEQYAQQASATPNHVFVSSQIYTRHATDLIHRRDRVVVLVFGQGDQLRLPCHVHTINVCLPQADIVRTLLSIARQAHKMSDVSAESSAAMPHSVRHAIDPDSAMPLTARQVAVLSLVARGFTNRQIADELGIALGTVLTHRKNILDKLGIRTVSALTIYAITHGIVRAEDV